jgi:16S rRNA (adenine1518-N6/adenine1519-N6)-dimethyltransferase
MSVEIGADAEALSPTTLDPDPLRETRLGAEVVRRYLRAHGLGARKSLSQHHLVDGDVVAAIVEAASPLGGRSVLEIGPGLGILTGALLRAGAGVTAVELDARLAAHLRERFAPALTASMALRVPDEAASGTIGATSPADATQARPSRLRLIEADFLDLVPGDGMDTPYDVVANLPYHVTSPILHRLLAGEARPDRLVLMLQREVAERIAARPGAMSYLSVFVQYHAAVRVVRIVPASAFEPAPEVDSAVVVAETTTRSLAPEDEDSLWRLVQAGFRERRKMIRNVLPRQLPAIGRGRFDDAFSALGFDPQARPQTLAVGDWIALARALGLVRDAP